jgi:hypothetical protein
VPLKAVWPVVPVPLVPVVLVPLVTELLMVTPSNALADWPLAFVAKITTALLPDCEGVPVIAPVAALTLRPNGTPDAL